jgi:hypothetical protein
LSLLFREGRYSYIQRMISQTTQWSLGLEKALYTGCMDLVHDSENLYELWNRRLGQLHYKELSILRGIVTGLLELRIEKKGVCKGCTLGKNAKDTFPSSKSKSKGVLVLIHSDVSAPISVA